MARGRTETNYQLFPGDRIWVDADPLVRGEPRASPCDLLPELERVRVEVDPGGVDRAALPRGLERAGDAGHALKRIADRVDAGGEPGEMVDRVQRTGSRVGNGQIIH